MVPQKQSTMKQHTLTLLLLFLSLQTIGQSTEAKPTKKENRKNRPAFIEVGIGTSMATFRDFATSPLFYKGSPLFATTSRFKIDEKRESKFNIRYTTGEYEATVEAHEAISKTETLGISYTKLYGIPKWSNEKWNVKAGGVLDATLNFRINESLRNNGLGVEAIGTLLGAIKVSKDISRKANKKIGFLALAPRQRKLSYQLNVGLLNNAYRNGYIYTNQSYVLNDLQLFYDYEFNTFSGFRIGSEIDYTFSLNNKNAFQIAYVWDAYTTGGIDPFEMATHTFKFSLLFNTK